MSEFEIISHIDEVVADKDKAVEQALTAIGINLVSEAQDELESDPRRVDTGVLKGSIGKDIDLGDKSLIVGTNVEYGIYVHEGTRKMAANRFLRNAFLNNLDNIRHQIEMYLSGKG